MSDIKKLGTEEILKEVLAKREALRQFRFGGAGGRARNVREGRTLRRDVARMLTEVRSRSLDSKGKTA